MDIQEIVALGKVQHQFLRVMFNAQSCSSKIMDNKSMVRGWNRSVVGRTIELQRQLILSHLFLNRPFAGSLDEKADVKADGLSLCPARR